MRANRDEEEKERKNFSVDEAETRTGVRKLKKSEIGKELQVIIQCKQADV
jgi:hypothetical protein